MWPFKIGEKAQVEEVISDIANIKSIEGITLLGGEPLDQREAVSQLVEETKKQGMSVILFTGYLYEDLKQSDDIYIQKILKNIDLLIDGPFIESRLDYSRPWTGSNNQNYIFLSDRYAEKDLKNIKQTSQYEIRVYPEGKIGINGMGDLDKIKKILKFNEQ